MLEDYQWFLPFLLVGKSHVCCIFPSLIFQRSRRFAGSHRQTDMVEFLSAFTHLRKSCQSANCAAIRDSLKDSRSPSDPGERMRCASESALLKLKDRLLPPLGHLLLCRGGPCRAFGESKGAHLQTLEPAFSFCSLVRTLGFPLNICDWGQPLCVD